jgi:hypothetical protein
MKKLFIIALLAVNLSDFTQDKKEMHLKRSQVEKFTPQQQNN